MAIHPRRVRTQYTTHLGRIKYGISPATNEDQKEHSTEAHGPYSESKFGALVLQDEAAFSLTGFVLIAKDATTSAQKLKVTKVPTDKQTNSQKRISFGSPM